MFIFDINFNTLSCMFDSMMINIRELCQYINNHDVKLKKSLKKKKGRQKTILLTGIKHET